MSILETVEKIFRKKTNYAEAEQMVDQAASLRYLSTDLYSDSKRFVYELLQNADDAGGGGEKVRVAVKLFGSLLVIAHSGKPFDDGDVKGVCGVDNGSKKNDPDKTGFKGIGFKAVFGVSDHVTVFTDGEYFRFDSDFRHEWNPIWGESQAAWELQEKRSFEVPWQIIPIYTKNQEVEPDIHRFLSDGGWKVATIVALKKPEAIASAIAELSNKANMFLFLKHISSIEFLSTKPTRITVDVAQDQRTSIQVNGEEHSSWFKKTLVIDIPQATQMLLKEESDMPEKLRNAKKVEITLAAKIGDEGLEGLKDSERLLYAYLPTEERGYGIPVLVNAAFYTAANREDLHKDAAWNEWLFGCIPLELLKWIAELVTGDYGFTAYNLLPSAINPSDKLALAYNASFNLAVKQVAFVLNKGGNLLRVNQSLMDYTFLSDVEFVGGNLIRGYKMVRDGLAELDQAPFVSKNSVEGKLKAAGVAVFDWKDFQKMLATIEFEAEHDPLKNRALIMHIKNLHDNSYVSAITLDSLQSWPFILNQRNELKSPKEVFFPAPGETYADDTEISFIHADLDNWAGENLEVKLWLQGLGVQIKSDLTFLMKVILPNVSTFVTTKNAIRTVRDIFNLFSKGQVGPEILASLGELKLLSKRGNLIPAHKSFYANEYHPHIQLEAVLDEDIYVTSQYLPVGAPSADWKNFFYYLGVKERIGIVEYNEVLSNYELINKGFDVNYLTGFTFKPYLTKFPSDSFKEIRSLSLLKYTGDNFGFAQLFWQDVVLGIPVLRLLEYPTAFWGNPGFPGRDSGDKVTAYLKWYVQHRNCLPTTTKECLASGKIFLNSEENRFAQNYLPVFAGPDLDADWRSFFGFRTSLELSDYLVLLGEISTDAANIQDNKSKIQHIYTYLLDQLNVFNSQQLQSIETWALTANFLDTRGEFLAADMLNHFIDGDHKVFGGVFRFIQLNKENQRHSALEHLLELMNVNIIRQSEFGLNTPDEAPARALSRRIAQIIPFWAKWMENEAASGYPEVLFDLQEKFKKLAFFQADELEVFYGDAWNKKVAVHFVENKLYTLSPWTQQKVMYLLPNLLCRIFGYRKHDRELEFLLRSEPEEIKAYFEEEKIGLPPADDFPQGEDEKEDSDGDEENEDSQKDGYSSLAQSTALNFLMPKASYQELWDANLVRNQQLIARCGDDAKKMLLDGLSAFLDGKPLNIYHFTHIENAISIIKQGTIKSRNSASFKDSAGSGIIAQTLHERKAYARFYFRPKTPTQYYVENLGRGQDSVNRIGSDPICPVPVFFILPLDQVMDQADWKVSIGSLSAAQVEYGNTAEIISRFDFDGVYRQFGEISNDRFTVSAHQEFLVKDSLDISLVPFHLGVQNIAAKETLLALLDDAQWKNRIIVDSGLFHNSNIKAEIISSPISLDVSVSKPHDGNFILQHGTDQEWQHIKGNILNQYNAENWMTSKMGQSVFIEGNLSEAALKLFYHYKGQNWLLYANTVNYRLDYSFIRDAVKEWFDSEDESGAGIINALKQHPELAYWYASHLPGPDGLTLESHTLEVISNFQKYFNKQDFFDSYKEYILCLALHDIGKPSAVLAGDKGLQHRHTLAILDKIKSLLPFSDDGFLKLQALIDGDPIGKHLDSRFSIDLMEVFRSVTAMASKISMDVLAFWDVLVVYYQCDAAGYKSLRDKLFLKEGSNEMKLTDQGKRLLFENGYEKKFDDLEEWIKISS
ncbi:DUF4433 domain-containing protein [Pedobacter sp. HDW13]|uniref:DarT ssDNA thymidine ADP-ribosyltransferase family protein n=1 Tax=Pedobacter sp. HDW13 TaxID=2714940 RepID=UPI00140BD77F|nr:DarT ssDNA thymidine ADP-ribosyltransferase family protein [Pedobacter sp. HDW13]QIL42380.1 DUF4433 domain-containing protein [Pedobacter sp. HDW13]